MRICRMRVSIMLLAALVAGAFVSMPCGADESYGVEKRKDVMVPMRDGAKLATDLYLPKAEGKFPTILVRTPYGKNYEDEEGVDHPHAKRGYVVAVQDCRGTGNSQGEWDPLANEREDGLDAQRWLLEQPWCNGSIGTTGGSYLGYTQWVTAPLAGDWLKCMYTVVPCINVYENTSYIGGAFTLGTSMSWGSEMLHPTEGEGAGIDWDSWNWEEAYRYLPLSTWDEQLGYEVPWMRSWIANPLYGPHWERGGLNGKIGDIEAPSLSISGWYDIFISQALDTVSWLRANGGEHHYLVIGPWGHGVNDCIDERDHGDYEAEFGELEDRWFDHWLKEEGEGIDGIPPYRIYVMGRNEWRDEAEWPLTRTRYTPFYFHSSGNANSLHGDGLLSVDGPGSEPADEFVYDPDDPVPTVGGCLLFGERTGAYDQREVEERDDVLVYTSEAMEDELEVTGNLKVVLYATSDARDTDWTAKLVDVYPDGRAYNLCDGVIRARRRVPDASPSLLEPGIMYRYEIDLWATSNVFMPGHRIRVEISSSNFPRVDRNPNTGNTFGADAELRKANQTVWHDALHPSHILLPVIPARNGS